MDAATVKLLNSTFGTSDYKPLDELILVENKLLRASDNLLMMLDNISGISVSADTKEGSALVDLGTFRPIVGGSMRISVNMSIKDATTTTSAYYGIGCIHVYINGTLKYTFSANNDGAGTSYVDKDLIGDVIFNKGDTISFKLQAKCNASNMTCFVNLNTFCINADVTGNLIKVIAE